MLGESSAVVQLLSLKQLGLETAGHYAAAILPAIVGFPIVMVCLAMMGLTVTHQLTFKQTFKNAVVVIANNLFFVPVTAAVSLVPIVGFAMGTMPAIITYLVMAAAGFSLIALGWVAMADRGMIKCKSLKKYYSKKHLAEVRKAAKANTEYNAPAKKPQAKQAYQNPKKKKKK